ncbi:DUF2723 domain-containing protein [Chitinophagaceae bacterium LWZ2-11]
MNFKKVNTIAGWIVCAIACTVFILTREATVSFWDCGEFIPCAYKLQISHPPGAPLFILLGRLFIILFSGNADATMANANAASQVNLLSAVSSGFTILFLFWTITHLAKKLLVKKDEAINLEKTIVIIAAGTVGGLAFAFSDSFWFSAVEGIVFGVSPLFISSAFWAILKWEERADQPKADRWIVLLAFVIGLSIGVHLLSILSIPAIVMTYYFRRYKFSRKGVILAGILACVLTGVVQIFVIQGTVKLIGWFELLFVNNMGLPFNSGSYFCILLLAAAIIFGLRYAIKKGRHLLELGIFCFTFLLIGYSTYAVILIRANAGPSINMQDVNNPIDLVAYLDRSQYGEWPVLRGADFTAKPTGTTEKGNIYDKNKNTGKYEVVGKKIGYDYDPADIHWFPRIWDTDNSQGHVDYYKSWLGIDGTEPPSNLDNIKWLIGYQINWMYWRYFLWNFAGRQNDVQGKGNPRDGNWISGIAPLDNWRLGDQSKLPDSLKNNKAHTTLFMLPFVLGVLGLIYQWKRDRKAAGVVFLLYFFTGIAIILYLNQAGPQPRERDYSMVGSFYAFAIWIGLGVLFVYELLKKKLTGFQSAMIAGTVCLLAVPVLMICQEWKAHDRSQKTLARDIAENYLNSCGKDAILFTSADNDTYPLWYAQEVENIRPDVRVIVTTLLGTDWMIDQLRTKVNQSPPIPFSWTHDKYVGDNRNYIPYYDKGAFSKDSFMNLNDAMAFMGSDSNRLQTQSGESMNYFPTRHFYLPVDSGARVDFNISGNALFKNDLAELNIIAANNWQRPVAFTFPPYQLGLESYVRNNGLAYSLVPTPQQINSTGQGVNIAAMYTNLLTKFKFGGAEKPNIYFDENGRRELMTIRHAFTELATALAISGNKDSALTVLNYGYKMLNPTTAPYGMVSSGNSDNIESLQYAYAYYLAGDIKKGDQIGAAIIHDCEQQIAYYSSLSDDAQASFQQDRQSAEGIMRQLQSWKTNFAQPKVNP